jgi:hypothetical protein
LLRRDFDGMQPTLRQVPPRVDRFSMHATWAVSRDGRRAETYIEALLAGLDGSNIARDAAADDDQVLLGSLAGVEPGGDLQMAGGSSEAVSAQISRHCHGGRRVLGLRARWKELEDGEIFLDRAATGEKSIDGNRATVAKLCGWSLLPPVAVQMQIQMWRPEDLFLHPPDRPGLPVTLRMDSKRMFGHPRLFQSSLPTAEIPLSGLN